jgi:hypothetical protein
VRTSLVLGRVVASTAAILSGTAAGTNRPPTGNGLERINSPEWPTVAAQLAKNIARASFAQDYGRVWQYLHPTYQKAVSRSHWHKCLRSHPAAPRNVTITNVSVAQATEVPVRLSLLGRQSIQEIELLVRFKTPTSASPQLAVLYTFWLKQGKAWTAVWLSDEYNAYKSGTCYLTPQGPPLY